MNNQNLIHLEKPGEKILLGNDHIILHDESTDIFKTDSITDLVKYLSAESHDIFVSESKIVAISREDSAVSRYNRKPTAECEIKLHPAFTLLSKTQGQEVELSQFMMFLNRMRAYLPSDTLSFSDKLRDLKIQKVFEVERKDNRRGNFSFSVRADSGKQDYQFPEKLVFNVPVILNCDDKIELQFDLCMDWSGGKEEGFTFNLMIENFEFDNIIRDWKRQVVMSALKNDCYEVFSGTYELIKQTDAWKYQKNELVVRG